MLYCQVFHSKETEDCPTNTVPMEDNANVKTNAPSAKPRYFQKQNKRAPKRNTERSWYSKTPEKMKQQQNNPDCTSPIQNNITINHYVYNVPGWTRGNEKEDTVEVVTSLKKKLTDRKRPRRKERKEIKRKIAEKLREEQEKNRRHVIFISDDESSDDCEVVPEDGGNIDLINDGNSNTPISSNDEEVLFVPSEPCEVIDLGSEDESAGDKESEQNAATDNSVGNLNAGVKKLSNGNSKSIKKVTSNESQESNDFLDSGVVQDSQDSFDFQLHGSEFNQCEQFVKPLNPSGEAPTTEHQETESESASSTTTGTDRGCSSEFSLTNNVFQESRKRGLISESSKKGKAIRAEQVEGEEKEESSEDSEESSSESEFEDSEQVQQRRLPELSLMAQTNTTNRKQKRQESSKEARTQRSSKTSTPKAVHTPSPLTPASGKVRKGSPRAKSTKKHPMRTEEQECDGSEERGSENELESSEEQREKLPEPSQLKTLNREQKRQESGNAEANETDNGVGETAVEENFSNEASVATGVSSKRDDRYDKARKRKAQKTKKRLEAQNKISKKRKNSARKGIGQATPPQQEEEPVESPSTPVEDPSSKDGAASDDDVVLIEKPIELIPVVDSDEEIEDIQLGVQKPSEERPDSQADDTQSNAAEKIADIPSDQAPIDLDLYLVNGSLFLDDPSKWQISRKDKPFYVALEQRQRTKGPRCNRCRQFGHTALKCTEKPEPPRLCLQPGHLATGCPDLWRRYHMTTEPGPIKVPTGPQLKPRHDQWCSGCASQGHLEHECYYYGRQYPPSLPYIINYDNVLFPEDAQQAVVSTKDTPERSTNADAAGDATHSKDTPGKRAPKHKTPNEKCEQISNSSKDISHTPQKRPKGLNEAQTVTVDPEMRLFDIAGYGIPPEVVNEIRPNHNVLNAPAGIWLPRSELIPVNEDLPQPPAPVVTALPSLLSLQFPPDFTVEEIDCQRTDAIMYRLGPLHNQKMKEYFLTAQVANLKAFVSSELKSLAKVRKANIEYLKKQVTHFATLKRISKEKNNAERHIPRRQRIAFFIAYDYIFSEELKHGINYPSLLQKLFVRKMKKKAKQQLLPRKQRASAQQHQAI
nr:unnamed protein product [Callosobruchus analis]